MDDRGWRKMWLRDVKEVSEKVMFDFFLVLDLFSMFSSTKSKTKLEDIDKKNTSG